MQAKARPPQLRRVEHTVSTRADRELVSKIVSDFQHLAPLLRHLLPLTGCLSIEVLDQ